MQSEITYVLCSNEYVLLGQSHRNLQYMSITCRSILGRIACKTRECGPDLSRGKEHLGRYRPAHYAEYPAWGRYSQVCSVGGSSDAAFAVNATATCFKFIIIIIVINNSEDNVMIINEL